MTKIYMAGPLFTTAERDFNAALAAQLRAAGHEIWLPQESEQRDATALSIFATDVQGSIGARSSLPAWMGPTRTVAPAGSAARCGEENRSSFTAPTSAAIRSVRTVQSDAASSGGRRH